MFMKNYSIWLNNIKTSSCNSVTNDLETDVLIIGGGITGISTLYELKQNNIKTILVERNMCGHGVTCRSTAKITFLQEKIYMNIRKYVGVKEAELYLKSQIEAVNMLKNRIEKENIDCDLKKVDSYIFTDNDNSRDKIKEEYKFLKQNKVNAQIVKSITFMSDVKLALKVSDTYVFHPLKYINYLKIKYKDIIYENSKLESIDKVDTGYIALVNGFKIKTKYVVFATHYPYFLVPYLMPLKSHIETSYIGAKKEKDFYSVSAINIDNPCISFRYHTDEANDYLIYLFNSYGSANIKSIRNNFLDLKEKNDFEYIWSNKDIITNDYLPYIGRIHKGDDTLLLATGYNTWGFSNGTLASTILSDIIMKKHNPYEELLSPNRSINLSKIIRMPIDIGSSIKAIIKSTKNNVNNSEIIYKKMNGKSVAIYTDEKGIEHIVYNRCPHMKCGIIFNEEEKTWDCLCHGSRFDIDGKCIEGPSNFDISFK